MLINKNHLDLYKPGDSVFLEHKIYSILTNKAEKEANGVTVFLSHKHNETDILAKVIALLDTVGVKVYLDWQDDEMPENTSGETAEKLKNKIGENKKFILLATNSAIASKWCNWELGYGDAQKYPDNIAIMPITENDGSWIGNEYLQIYPTIRTDYAFFKGDYYVEYKDKKIKFVDWLKS